MAANRGGTLLTLRRRRYAQLKFFAKLSFKKAEGEPLFEKGFPSVATLHSPLPKICVQEFPLSAESGSGLRPKTPPPFEKGGRKLLTASALNLKNNANQAAAPLVNNLLQRLLQLQLRVRRHLI